MVLFPNCKINLGLRILRKRADGYHDLQTLFYPLPFFEGLEAISAGRPALSSTGIPIPGLPEDNLCLRAYKVLKTDFPRLPSVHIHLHKTIPPGSGLGAGSANAAFTLKLLNEKFALGLDNAALLSYASRLGSDCAFFILNQPCLAAGRGEELVPVTLDLSAYHFAVLCPQIPVSTAWAFSQITPSGVEWSAEEWMQLLQQPPRNWRNQLINDFEEPILKSFPDLSRLKDLLYESGALYASLSGSGSALYGIFEEVPAELGASLPPSCLLMHT